jgi:hypothetical protein
MTSFTLQCETHLEKAQSWPKNKGKAVLPLTARLCKFVMIVKAA